MARLSDLRSEVRNHHLADETGCIKALIKSIDLTQEIRTQTVETAARLVDHLRTEKRPGLMEVFLVEYGLSTREGIALMCLAEALLRVPDAKTMDDLIEDKLLHQDWAHHIGQSENALVNASTWALMLTGKVLTVDDQVDMGGAMRRLVKRLGEPVIRRAVKAAMKEMGNQFVLGETIENAVKRGAAFEQKGYTYSYDMLGEAALTDQDAQSFVQSYTDAIKHLAGQSPHADVRQNPGISIKLSALYPRYELRQKDYVMDHLVERTLDLVVQARAANMGLNIDAEEADRLDLSLDVIEAVLSDPRLAGWDGFGVVVQAYSKRAPFVIRWLYALAKKLDRKIMIRLVKGAYWDSEIKRAQVDGLPDFPVFTKKCASDISYIACARLLLNLNDRIYPQFATHNAHSVQTILDMVSPDHRFEFQRLHGMGEALYDTVMEAHDIRCRIYAPVGIHDDLLAYLVRRLLENGANSSFVNQIVDKSVPARQVVEDPFDIWNRTAGNTNAVIARPINLYQPERLNSIGFDTNNVTEIARIDAARADFAKTEWHVAAQLATGLPSGPTLPVYNPADPADHIGTATLCTIADVESALSGSAPWDAAQSKRAMVLNRAADLYESHFGELFTILAREAGKTINDAVAELREAVDFLRYYAAQSVQHTDQSPCGHFVCISPWNFPLAIFTGQIAAALSVGNAVLAKPAEPTPIIATRAVELMYQAGVPRSALQLLIGPGREIGGALVADPRVNGVCFTGSTATAQHINRSMAATGQATAPLIAETGGLNAMIVDSTALPEQAVRDIITSAFQSAGQRCSALRMLYLQEDIAAKFLTMLYGAMDAQSVGSPWEARTDIGPVIDAAVLDKINTHIAQAQQDGRVLYQVPVPETGTFAPPTVIQVKGIADLKEEIFGPVLHIATYKSKDIDTVVHAINASGYGLTFGVHSRIESFINTLCSKLNVGNIYVNRNQIGAIVGSQPFGGEGLSGTGPKAGGPHYLNRFLQPQTLPSLPYTDGSLDIHLVQSRLNDLPLPPRAAQQSHNLPGPTGEINRLSLYPRGKILCLGPTLEYARAQADKVRNTGCSPLIVTLGASEAEGISGTLSLNHLKELEGFDAVILWGDENALRMTRKALARRSGPLIPLIHGKDIENRCIHERHICIDTTAAGGNAALLAIGG